MKMIDALYPDSIPAGTTCDAIAAYIDHSDNPGSFAQAVARFPDAQHIRITVTGDTAADAIDGESGTGITPADAAEWARKKRAAGQPFVIYCNETLTDAWGFAAYKAAVQAVGIDPATVLWWTANYDGVAQLRPGEWARQYTDRDQNRLNTYDTSITATDWPPNGDTVTPQEIQDVAKAVWEYPLIHADATGKSDSAAHPARVWLTDSNIHAAAGVSVSGQIVVRTAALQAQVAAVGTAVAAVPTVHPTVDVDLLAAAIVAKLPASPSIDDIKAALGSFVFRGSPS